MKETLFKAFRNWGRHATQDKAAALTYYTLLSFPPIVLLLLNIAKVVAISNKSPEELVANIAAAFPADTGEFVSQFALRSLEAANIWVTLLTLLFLLWSASALVDALERAVNVIFEAKIRSKRQTFSMFLQRKLTAFLSLLFFVSVLLLSFILPTYFSLFFNGAVVTTLELATTFGVLTIIFASMLRWLPYVVIAKRDAWLSGAVLALVTLIGKVLLTYIFGLISFTSDFSVGTSIVLFLIWVYYTTSIILFGIEVIRSWLVLHNKITFKPYAVTTRS